MNLCWTMRVNVMAKDYKVGDDVEVWWTTGRTAENGRPLAKILEIRPYEGPMKQYSSLILRLTAPSTKKGWLEMTV
jgi:hypothetical protein